MVEPSVDPSEGEYDGMDAALKFPSAYMRSTLRVATSVIAVLTRTLILSESSLGLGSVRSAVIIWFEMLSTYLSMTLQTSSRRQR